MLKSYKVVTNVIIIGIKKAELKRPNNTNDNLIKIILWDLV